MCKAICLFKSFLFSFISKIPFFIIAISTQMKQVYALTLTTSQVTSFNLTTAYLICAFISFILLLGYLAYVKKRETLFIFLYSSVFLVNVGYTFLSASSTISEALLANRISYLGAVFLPLFLLLIIAEESKIKFPKWLIILLILASSLTFLLAASPGYSTVYYQSVELVINDSGSYLTKIYGPLHQIYYFYLLAYFSLMILTIIYSYYKNKNESLRLALHLLACVFCNIGVWYLGQIFHFRFEFLSISYILTEIHLLSLYNMLEQFYGTNQNTSESSMVTMIVESDQTDEIHREYDFDLTISIEEIIRLWPQVSQLTPREIEVFKLLIQNKKRRDIADELCVSENTVKKHTSNIFAKLNISNRTEIIKIISKIKTS